MLWGIVATLLGGLGGWFLAPFVASWGLLAWGMGAAGPIAGESLPRLFFRRVGLTSHNWPGTAAAAAQASIGNVVAGSIFAFLQSIAMGGLSIIGLAIGGVMGGVFGFLGGLLGGWF